jgi:hypothetical protein
MINLKQQQDDALRGAINALSTAQTPNEALLKRLRALTEINKDIAGVITFVERAAKLEQQLAETQRKLAGAQMFDMRKAGVRHDDAPSANTREFQPSTRQPIRITSYPAGGGRPIVTETTYAPR